MFQQYKNLDFPVSAKWNSLQNYSGTTFLFSTFSILLYTFIAFIGFLSIYQQIRQGGIFSASILPLPATSTLKHCSSTRIANMQARHSFSSTPILNDPMRQSPMLQEATVSHQPPSQSSKTYTGGAPSATGHGASGQSVTTLTEHDESNRDQTAFAHQSVITLFSLFSHKNNMVVLVSSSFRRHLNLFPPN